MIRNGSDYQMSVHNSLIDMYCECYHLCNTGAFRDSGAGAGLDNF